MEFKNKVYINPNFKRNPQTSVAPLHYYNTAYVNRHFSQELSQGQVYQLQDDANNRRIHVNPNFIAVNKPYDNHSVAYNYMKNYNITHINSNTNVNQGIPNTCNVINNMEQQHSINYDILQNKNTILHRTLLLNSKETYTTKQHVKVVQPIISNSIEAPLTKTRYSLVRKPNPVPNNIKVCINYKDTSPRNTHISPYSSTSIPTTDKIVYTQCQKSNLINKTPQKVTKIRISKYKTVPISTYLKSNAQILLPSTIKQPTATHSCSKVQGKNTRTSCSLAVYNRNRYKFVKPKISVVSIMNSSIKTTPLKLKRNISLNKSKTNVRKANFKVNNIPCRLFTKYGKCLRKDYGKCDFLHDKKHVSLCRKFLKGICHDKNCTLSHELTKKKMPTCYFYLRGMCTKQNCPYLHIKLSDKTKICQDFIRGYCEKGDKCPFRHVKTPDSKARKRSKPNLSCSSIQTKAINIRNEQNKLMNKNIVNKTNAEKLDTQDKSESDCRYYDEVMNNESTCEIIKPTRCKLGILPSFIQL